MNNAPEAEPPEKSQSKIREWIAAITAPLGVFVSLINGAVNVPWLKWAALALGIIATVLVIGLAWSKWATPALARRRRLKVMRAKAKQLPNYVRKFLEQVANDNHTGSILYNVRSIHELPSGAIFGGQEKTQDGRFLRELCEGIVQRYSEEPRGLAEIEFSLATFDKIMGQFRNMYTDWRKALLSHWHEVPEYNQTALVVSSGTYIKFVDDYQNFRKADAADDETVASLYLPAPEPLPSVMPKAPKPPAPTT